MDYTMIKQNLFLEIRDQVSDIAVVPIEFQMDFTHKIKSGASSRFGYVQEMKRQLGDIKINLKPCIQLEYPESSKSLS